MIQQLASSSPFALPVELLSQILTLSIESYDDEWSCGGALAGWDSHELVAPLAGVARSWKEPTEQVLYRSIACVGELRTNKLLSQLRSRPDLAARVRKLAIGLGDEDEIDEMSFVERRKVSIKLVYVVELCPNLQQLQVRALHQDSWDRLSALIQARALDALVASPRVVTDLEGWAEPSTHLHDAFWAHPTLKTIEIEHNWIREAESVASDKVLGSPECGLLPPQALSHSPPAPISLPLIVGGGGFPHLTRLRIHSFMPAEMLFHLIHSAGKTLQVLDVYTELALSPKFDRAFVSAFIPTLPSLRKLRFISNPPLETATIDSTDDAPRVLDALLPHFHRLTSITASSADVSPAALARLPAGLKHIKVEVFRPLSSLCKPIMVLDALRNPKIDFKDVETITMCDEDDDVWAALDAPMVEAARARGITLTRLGEVDSGRLDQF